MLRLIPLVWIPLAAGTYAVGVARLRQRGDAWSGFRSACFGGGLACMAVTVLPPLASHDEYFPVHVVQHLLLAMAGPMLLALSAPVTLALRTVPQRVRRPLLLVLHSRLARLLTTPATALVLDLGGLTLLYLTPLYALTTRSETVHGLVHVHMILTGCLLSWVLVGIDPMPRRRGVRVRLTVLVIAAAGHDMLAKYLYAQRLPSGAGPAASRADGAMLLYYGGTAIDVLLATVLMAQWYRSTGRALNHAQRRSAVGL